VSGTQFRVLGPVEAVREGTPLPLGGPKQRALLALLLIERDHFISADRLADKLWNGKTPAGAQKSLRSYVTRLRRTLGGDVPIAGTTEGYALEIPREQVDALRFEAMIRAGEEALARGAAVRAHERFQEALALWRGRPFGELGDEGLLRVEADRLEELRLFAAERCLEAELQLGRSGELVDELESLVHSTPIASASGTS